jgi:gliding motility-associated-like protein
MTRAHYLAGLFLLISVGAEGQCVNAPTVSLSSYVGTTCGTTLIMVGGNTFGGSATRVKITTDGSGNIGPSSTSTQPFNFTYTPANKDIGKQVLITLTTDTPKDNKCPPATAVFTLTVSAIPQAPIVGNILQPSCASVTGSVGLSGLPSTGNWTVITNPGGFTASGTGSTTTFSGLITGSYTFTVKNSSGCTSPSSISSVITAPPPKPVPPVIGTVTQPRNGVPTGSVILSGLPATGSWTLTLSPANIAIPGNGSTTTVSGLVPGTYSVTVTNSSGCTSNSSAGFSITRLSGPPVVIINNPLPVCSPSTVNLTDPKITAGSSSDLIYTYWLNEAATIQYSSPGAAADGTYYIKGTSYDGSFSVRQVIVRVYEKPLANAGPDQVLANITQTTLNAQLYHNYETGLWLLVFGSGHMFDATMAKTTVSGLSSGENKFLWTVTNGVCPASSDTVMIAVRDNVLSNLITPNMDGKNDYFIIKKPSDPEKMELTVFDRRGVEVYHNTDYDNSWNGVDYNGKELPDDTYFYLFESNKGIPVKGFIVIRR